MVIPSLCLPSPVPSRHPIRTSMSRPRFSSATTTVVVCLKRWSASIALSSVRCAWSSGCLMVCKAASQLQRCVRQQPRRHTVTHSGPSDSTTQQASTVDSSVLQSAVAVLSAVMSAVMSAVLWVGSTVGSSGISSSNSSTISSTVGSSGISGSNSSTFSSSGITKG